MSQSLPRRLRGLGVAGKALTALVVGGWYVLDGVQHLRYGVTRDEVGVPYRHDGGVLAGLPKTLLARLAEPLLLSYASTTHLSE